MPWAPPKHCARGHQPYTGPRCPLCKAASEARRPSARKRGYDRKWQLASKEWLAQPRNRLCVCGCGQVADVVDHRIPHKGDMGLFWDRTNWQPMNRRCHSRKTAQQDGGFGNPIAGGGGTFEF